MTQTRPQNPSQIATKMRVEGMNTAKILIALYESQILLKDARVSNQVLRCDVIAATERSNMPSTDQLSKVVNNIEDGAATLQKKSDTRPIGEQYFQRTSNVKSSLQTLEEDQNKLKADYEVVRNKQKEIRKLIAETSNDVPKKEIEELLKLTNDFAKNAEKFKEKYEGQKVVIEDLRKEISRYTVLPEVKRTTEPTPTSTPQRE